jgi:hypothetical protein
MTISLTPRQFSTQINIDILSDQRGHYVVSLQDLEGKIFSMMSLELLEGINAFSMNQLQHLSAGSYSFHFINHIGKTLYNTKLIKQ